MDLVKKTLDKSQSNMKITQGYKLVLPYEPKGNLGDFRYRKSNGYFKAGIKLEVFDWLEANVGEYCKSYYQWENGHGDWLYTGTQLRPMSKGSHRDTVTLYFREKDHAILFKLAWCDRL